MSNQHSTHQSKNQKGAALVVVLLLVATLSVIALAISETTIFASRRAINDRARSQTYWFALGAEAFAKATLEDALGNRQEARPFTYGLDDQLFELPLPDGDVRLRFIDASRCFNLNSLSEIDSNRVAQINEPAAEEFTALAAALGAPGPITANFIAVIADWIDDDRQQSPDGAEDDFYLNRPTPYRTGGVLLADRSEILAMADVTREEYRRVKHQLCTQPTTSPALLNVNALTKFDAPLLVALTGGELNASAARDAIAQRPLKGYGQVTDFWAIDAFSNIEVSEAMNARAVAEPKYVEARAEIAYDKAFLEVTVLFEIGEGEEGVVLVNRRFGSEL